MIMECFASKYLRMKTFMVNHTERLYYLCILFVTSIQMTNLINLNLKGILN